MFKKNKNEYSAKKVRKAIRKIEVKYKIKKGDNKIEKVYLRKKAIKEYYDKNHRKIKDNDLLIIYNKIFNPSILIEIAIGVFSGMLANAFGDLFNAKTSLPDNGISGFISSIIARFIIFVILIFLIIWAYKEIISLHSYTYEVDNYHKELVHKLIKEREAEFEKRCKNEPKHNRKNSKNKQRHRPRRV